MKKNQQDVDVFYPSELQRFLKHFKHRKYPGEKVVAKNIRHAKRRDGKRECFDE